MPRIGLTLLPLTLLALTACLPPAPAYRRIDAAAAAGLMLADPGLLVLDVRTPEEFAAGHIPGALSLPLETLADDIRHTLPDPGRRILVYCRSGNRSAKAAEALVRLGYTDVIDIGGIRDWTGPVEFSE